MHTSRTCRASAQVIETRKHPMISARSGWRSAWMLALQRQSARLRRSDARCSARFCRNARLILLLCAALIAVASCGSTATPSASLTPVTVQLAWTHGAQFAGLYAADQNGYYAAEGLAVRLVETGPSDDRLVPVLADTAQFGIASPVQLIPARADGKPLRAIAAIYRRDPFVFFALADSGITRPADFVGKTIQLRPPARPLLRTVMTHAGIAPGQYKEDNDSDYTALYSGAIDVATGFVTNEVLAAQAAGHKLNLIYPDDYGVHFYSDTLFSTDDFLAAHPDVVLRFLRATLKGWTYAVEHPTAVAPLVLKYKSDADAAHENATMAASLPLVNTGEDQIGWMKPEIWDGMAQTLRDQGLLTKPVDLSTVYTLQFLQELYGSSK